MVALVSEPARHVEAHTPHAPDSYFHLLPPSGQRLLTSQHADKLTS
jgi:hypothetical protein